MSDQPTSRDGVASRTLAILVTINGTDHSLDLEPRVSLLDALRERLHLTGTKKGCDQGACGACTVHVEGRRVLSHVMGVLPAHYQRGDAEGAFVVARRLRGANWDTPRKKNE